MQLHTALSQLHKKNILDGRHSLSFSSFNTQPPLPPAQRRSNPLFSSSPQSCRPWLCHAGTDAGPCCEILLRGQPEESRPGSASSQSSAAATLPPATLITSKGFYRSQQHVARRPTFPGSIFGPSYPASQHVEVKNLHGTLFGKHGGGSRATHFSTTV
ncbi:hypothetical protein Micbo1qcDRAFT_41658 [Microdochium bolleyi]|uniref:Uncharacterized protein n=1 Tax=Microdochium bolleyi TaxID=196109 RepID=A0A136JAI2_9PEZI|nr:hypothetical protein Micbo1qcDRAFT_41658 [Microdochium bolleyi]